MRDLKVTPSITNRTPLIDKYFEEINKEKILTHEEELELAKKIQDTGCQESIDKLVKANLRFVISVAKKYENATDELIDLINDGNEGLIKAAKQFKPEVGVKFISYAVWLIRQHIMDGKTKNSRLVRLPSGKNAILSKIKKTTTKLMQELEREPTEEEVCEELNLNMNVYHECIKGSYNHKSLDEELIKFDGDSIAPIEFLESDIPMPDQNLLDKSLKYDIMSVLNCLDERERKVIRLYFGLGDRMTYQKPKSFKEIAEVIDGELTVARIRQIKNIALAKLQKYNTKNLLKKYLTGSN